MNWSLVIGHWLFVPGPCSLWLAACGLFYSLLIGFFTFGWYWRKKSSVVSLQSSVFSRQSSVFSLQSSVSVVIAVRDEERYIRDLLEDLLVQDYPGEFLEIIVVDDHSTDNTHKIVSDFIDKHRFPEFILLKNTGINGSGKKAAIDFGIKHSSGDIIITTDADCRVGPGWISSLTGQFQEEKISMVFGPVAYQTSKNITDKFQSLEFLGLVASSAGAAMAGHPFMCNGANLAYRKSAFQQVKGYEGNEKYISGDDVFLLHKMKKEFGRKAVVFCKNENAIVKTYPLPGLKRFISQRIRWASKSKSYKDPLSILTAIVVFSYSLTVLSSFIAGFFDPVFFLAFGGLFMLKMMADFPLILGITGFTGQRKLMRWYIPFQVVYPAYVVLAGMLSFVKRKKW